MASNSNFSGLNVATKAGEGYAHINHWENFYNTVNSIHQEDLTNQKMIRDAVAKSSLEVAEAQKGIRAIEIPKFKEAADKFTNAALVAASPDVQKNPKLLAQWTQKKNDAYMEAITIAEGSKAAVKRKNDIVNDIFKAKGVGFKSQEELNPIFNEYDNTYYADISKKGLDTPIPWTLPPDLYSKADYEKNVIGAPKEYSHTEEVKNANGQVIARQDRIMTKYPNSPAQVASETSKYLRGVYDIRAGAQLNYTADMKDRPEVVQNTIEKAQKIIDATADDKVKPKLTNDYIGYETARNILKTESKDLGSKNYREDPEYKRQKDEAFKIMMADKLQKGRVSNIYLSNALKRKGEEPDQVNTDILYNAAKNPTQTFSIKMKDGKTMSLSGSEILNSGIQAIAGNNPKNVEAIQLNRFNLVSKDARRSIVEKLLPNLGSAEREELITEPVGDDRNKGVQHIIDKINETYGQNIKIDDVNRYGIPVFISKKYQADQFGTGQKIVVNPIFANPATNDGSQFHSIISNIVNSKKAAQMSRQNPNYISNLQALSQDEEE